MKATKEILEFPWMTEKSTAIRMTSNSYVFKVKPSANKIEIKQAIEEVYEVKVAAVNTLIVKGKRRQVGRSRPGKTADWKKAIVTIADASNAGRLKEIFEGA